MLMERTKTSFQWYWFMETEVLVATFAAVQLGVYLLLHP